MPKSLRCEIKHLCHNGTLTERERDRILKALEQEDVLDKIRAEIKQMDFDFGDYYDHTDRIREMVLEVVNKYKEGEADDE